MQKRFPLLALYLTVLLVVAGGTTAYGVLSETVEVSVNGKTETVRTFGEDVGDVLTSMGVEIEANDHVTPSLTSAVEDGDTISVQTVRALTLIVDGYKSRGFTFADTVGEALEARGIDPNDGANVSAKPSTEIPEDGLTVVVSNQKEVTVNVGGESKVYHTSAPTVGDVLQAASIELDKDDEIEPGADSYVRAGWELNVIRVESETKTVTVPVAYEIEVRKDSDMYEGEKDVIRAGEKGKKREHVTVTTANSEVREREVHSSTLVAEPVAKIVVKGTKDRPQPTYEGGSGVWDRIAQCESGGNWHINTGNGYYGGLQFSAATWHSVGGPGLPHQHSRAVQIYYAEKLQARSGWGQWGCAHARFG